MAKQRDILFCFLFLFAFQLCIFTAFATLPFGTRGGQKADDEDHHDDHHAEAVFVDGSNVPVMMKWSGSSGKSKNNRNVIVEEFFANAHSAEDRIGEEIQSKASDLHDFLIATRRTLHMFPELMFNERETSAIIQKKLQDLDISFTTGWAINTNRDRINGNGGYGIVADIGTGSAPCVLLRADMDALPVMERTEGVDAFKSRHDGKMHACGHDGHTTMLLGAAAILKGMEDSINGTVRLMFQPAEEGGAGAKRMIEEGLLDVEPKPSFAFAMHLWPTLPSGSIASRPGPLLAAAERFDVLISGVGGHAAMPHLTIDPVVAASSIVMNLQTLVSRKLSPLESGVCTVTVLEAGEAFNIIPASATLKGTLRALSTETLLSLRDRFQRMVTSTAEVHGCNVTITYSPDYYPPTVNDPKLFETFSKTVGASVSNEGFVRDIEPTMGGEDFSFITEKIPSTFFLLGQGSGTEPQSHYGLHHPHFAIDETVLSRGVELHVNLALRGLQKLAEEEENRMMK